MHLLSILLITYKIESINQSQRLPIYSPTATDRVLGTKYEENVHSAGSLEMEGAKIRTQAASIV